MAWWALGLRLSARLGAYWVLYGFSISWSGFEEVVLFVFLGGEGMVGFEFLGLGMYELPEFCAYGGS